MMPPTKFLGTPYLEDPDLTIWNEDVREESGMAFSPERRPELLDLLDRYLRLNEDATKNSPRMASRSNEPKESPVMSQEPRMRQSLESP